MLDEMPHQQWNVLRALPKRRDMNGKHVQPVKQIGPELLRLHQCPQVGIGGRDQARVRPKGPAVSEPLELPLLEHA